MGDAAGPASCMGLESSNISPPGSSDELPGGRKEFNQQVKEFNESLPAQVKAAFTMKLDELTKQHAVFDSLGIPAGARDFAALGGGTRIAAGTVLPAPVGVFPRYIEPAA